MNVLSVCSGIGAPECAWTPLGFKFVGASEIEEFPSAVLEHHYPDVPNFGDLNNYKEWNIDDSAISVIVGGTPCVSFSVAGLRRGLDDERGNLSLVFIRLCERVQPKFIVWENVPGVLSSNGGKDFGAFTGALSEIGYSFAWRILDAQFFRVPQRRRRVFLIGYRGNWRYPAAILFEPKSMRGDTPKSGKAGEDIAPTVVCGPPYSRTGNQRVEAEALVLQRMRGFGDYTESNHASALKARDYKDATDLVLAVHENTRSELRLTKEHPPLTTGGGKPGQGYPCIVAERARRIMPSEAELLQGFPKGYTDITYRGKPAPDTQRYKALGNSMAVPVLRWLGQRMLRVKGVIDEHA
tara:strand:+ start:416 stop:1474 length:1059 start_codon:yes stop_codon:yes gene_type:complete